MPYQCTYLGIDAMSGIWVKEIADSDMVRKKAVNNFQISSCSFYKKGIGEA